MKELMVHVERAVRPVKATRLRKLHMRDELLAHLRGIYDEELAQTNDHVSAVTRAIERFGAAGELSRNLKASVPWYDPLLPWLKPFRYRTLSFWSLTLWGSVIELILVVLMLAVLSPFYSGIVGLEYLAVLLVWAAILPPLLLTLTAMAGTYEGVLGHRKSPARAILYGVGLAAVLLPGALFVVAQDGLNVFKVTYAIAIATAMPVIIALVARRWGKEVRKDEETLARLDEWEEIEPSGG